MNTIVAASAEAFRARLREKLLEAVADEISTAETPHALSAVLADTSDPVVITGNEWPVSRAFLRTAVAARVPAMLVLDLWDAAIAEQAVSAGARAVLGSAPAALAPALAAVRAGLFVLSEAPVRATELPRSSPDLGEGAARALTNRERQILSLIAAGTSNKGIARALGVSANTVKFHLGAAFEKLNVATRAEAVAAAIRRGELSL